MTPVTPPSKSNGSDQCAISEDEWRPEGSGVAQDDEEEYQDEDDDEDEDYGAASKKRKLKGKGGSAKSKGKGRKANGSKDARAPASVWTNEELLAMFRATFQLALQNVSIIKAAQGLEKRDGNKVNIKMRAEFKKLDKSLGGDAKWLDTFKATTKNSS